MSIAIVPGSFDPMTLGHLELVKTVAKRYDEVVVAVMVNRAKKYLFDEQTRVSIAEETVKELSNVRVIVDHGMLIDLFDKLNADAVCKGWRNQHDYDYELHMADWNSAHNPRFRTEMIRAKSSVEHISSSEVRRRLVAGEPLEDIVHSNVEHLIFARFIENGGK
ncbi:MAG: pantetheine-phosphate adenylyltransferase [Clostridia bacterium]|nr:pantetheine-phosphate adenylyltransferase [Clostridia bacterium]